MQIKQRITNEALVSTLINKGVSPLFARLFAARGVSDASALTAQLGNILPPNSLTHNQTMATLLADAIDRKSVV